MKYESCHQEVILVCLSTQHVAEPACQFVTAGKRLGGAGGHHSCVASENTSVLFSLPALDNMVVSLKILGVFSSF